VAYVLHFVPVFCPPKKAAKRTGFSKKEKPYTSHLTRAKWQEKLQFSSNQFP
jgi:glutaredoxin